MTTCQHQENLGKDLLGQLDSLDLEGTRHVVLALFDKDESHIVVLLTMIAGLQFIPGR